MATVILFRGKTVSLYHGCIILIYPDLFLAAASLDACAALVFGIIFICALTAHVNRIRQSVDESRVITIYSGLFYNDLIQLIASAISSLVLILIYTLVSAPDELAHFFPIALSRKSAIITPIEPVLNLHVIDAVTGFFIIESLKSGVRTRRRVSRQAIGTGVITLDL
jgi:hypothetical protein